MRKRSWSVFLGGLSFAAAVVASAKPAGAQIETFALPNAANNTAAAPFIDMVVDTTPTDTPPAGLTAWGDKGAVGLQGNQSEYPNGSGGYYSQPASTVAFKFNIGSVIDLLNSNASYGTGNWTVYSATLSLPYTFYSNNNIFGGGAGSFETYWVANDSWAYGKGSNTTTNYGGNSITDSTYINGTDPAYATNSTSLSAWSGGQSDLGSTTYNWLSLAQTGSTWTTQSTGPNSGVLTDTLTLTPAFLSAIMSASATNNDPYLSFYLIPNDNTLGLTIFTGGGNSSNPSPDLSLTVVPEPAMTALALVCGVPMLLRRRRRV
jgi:hypothetical protein